MKIILTGATGFIGQPLLNHLLQKGHSVTAMVRKATDAASLPCAAQEWPTGKNAAENLKTIFKGMDAVIHLAGAPVAQGRWTEKRKRNIYDSRIGTTRQIVEALALLPPGERPSTLLNASAIGIYGDAGDKILTEDSIAGAGFLAKVTDDWEAAALKAKALNVRIVLLRNGIVLGPDGGALAKMQPVTLGTGNQWMSWAHINDVVGFIEYALINQNAHGAYNLTAPNPETNLNFTKKLAEARKLPVLGKIPAFALKILMGEMATMILASQRVTPKRATTEGFRFRFETLEAALAEIYPPS